MIVVDASLAAKWLVDEPGFAEARAFLHQFSGALVAPDLIEVEVGGALVRRANLQEIARDSAIQSLQEWSYIVEAGAVRLASRRPERLEAAMRLATSIGHPFKDCIYLALAIELECPLATCDAKFVGKATRLYSEVKLLNDFELAPEEARKP